MHRIIRFLLLTCLWPAFAGAQPDSPQEVKGIPTKQVFDLMVDSRGFLWIGHDLGLSRFDGNSFTHFSSPLQNSLAVSDILEDPQGRIWCRNFSSQIFYVENEKLNLLAAYEFRNEPKFPRMVIIGNKLIASSVKGLFVCNTTTLESCYISCEGVPVTSISVINDKIIAFGEPEFYSYDPAGTGAAHRLDYNYPPQEKTAISLQPYSYKDTMYSFSPLSGFITKLLVTGNTLTIAGKIITGGLMNTINPSGNATWIHTKEQSKTIEGDRSIPGINLTDLVVDKEGNTWYSSFKFGLMVTYKNYWEKIQLPGIDENDIISRMDAVKDVNIYGTTAGKIMLQDNVSGKIIRVFTVPPEGGPVEYIKAIDASRVIISTSLRIYMLQGNMDVLENVSHYLTLKNAVAADSTIYLAAATGLYELITLPGKNGRAAYATKMLSNVRCRWVDYNKSTGALLVAFKHGLAEVRDKQVFPIVYNGVQVPAITTQLAVDKFYISTFGEGMMKLDASGIRKINILDEYKSNPVFQIKAFKDTVWLRGAGFIVLFDPKADTIYHNRIIPAFPNADIFDIAWISGQTVLLTGHGLFALRSSQLGYTMKNYLLKIAVNGKDTAGVTELVLPYHQNSLEFFPAVPFFSIPGEIYFKYRLKGSADEEWKTSENGVSRFRFSSLRPGTYSFEAIAVHSQFGRVGQPVIFPFTIRPVWHETKLFRLFLSLCTACIIVLFVSMFFKTRLKHQKIVFERQLAVRNERERISAEIHDDIGAGLSGVRLLTELTSDKTSNKESKEDLGKIHTSITELSVKMQEVIWSLNTANDTLDSLLLYIRRQALKLFEHSRIHLVVNLPEMVPILEIGSDKRADIYLSVKEALHNALKHSEAKNIELDFTLANDRLLIAVRDDGQGITAPGGHGNGMLNMRKRIARLQGTMTLKEEKGLTVLFSIPLQ